MRGGGAGEGGREEERMAGVFWEVQQKEHILLGAPHLSSPFLMSLIKANGNISTLPSSAISSRRRKRREGAREVMVEGGVPCLAGRSMPGRGGRGGVIEGEEMPQGRRWGSKCE